MDEAIQLMQSHAMIPFVNSFGITMIAQIPHSIQGALIISTTEEKQKKQKKMRQNDGEVAF